MKITPLRAVFLLGILWVAVYAPHHISAIGEALYDWRWHFVFWPCVGVVLAFVLLLVLLVLMGPEEEKNVDHSPKPYQRGERLYVDDPPSPDDSDWWQ